MTWGRKEGSKTYGNHYPPVATYEGMQQRLATSYLEMAYRSGGWCAPVGLAWMRVRSEKPEYELYMPDGSHPSEAGTLLAANVIFSVIYGKPYTSDIRAGVPQQQAEYLRQVAQQTVFDNLRLINVEPVAPGPLPEIALPRK